MPSPNPNSDPAFHHEPFKGEAPAGTHDRSLHYDPNASRENPVVISHTFDNAAPSHSAVPGHYNGNVDSGSSVPHSHTGSTTSTHPHSHPHSHEGVTGAVGAQDTFTRDRREHDTVPSASTNANPQQHNRHLNDANPGPEHVTPGSTVSSTSSAAASQPRNTRDSTTEAGRVDAAERSAGAGDGGISGPTGGAGEAREGEAGYAYPPQLHAGKVGLGPHYHAPGEAGIGAKIKGAEEKLKGKITHNPALVQQGEARATGHLANEAQNTAGEENAFTRPDDGATQGNKGGALPAKGTTASDVRESGHAASASAGTAGTKYD